MGVEATMNELRESYYMPPKILSSEINLNNIEQSNSMVKEDGISTLKDNIITPDY